MLRLFHIFHILPVAGALLFGVFACSKPGPQEVAVPGQLADGNKGTLAQTQGGEVWYRVAVGGMWDEIGRLQFKYLVSQGLNKDHFLLDVGCGSLRGGVHFARYLESGHYYGIDIDKALLEAGRIELKKNNLIDKDITLVEMGDFSFESLNRKFDFALAQSVFTHLPLNSIIRCLMNMDRALVPGGKFYATFFDNPEGKHFLGPLSQFRIDGRPGLTYFDRDPYHYDLETFQWICSGTTLKVEYLGDWGHPRNQKMLRFTKQ